MDFLSLLSYLVVFLLVVLIFVIFRFGNSEASRHKRHRNNLKRDWQYDDLSILPYTHNTATDYVPDDSHTTEGHHGTDPVEDPASAGSTDYGSSWDSGSNVETSGSALGGFDSSGALGSDCAGEIGSDFGGGDSGGFDSDSS